MSYYLQDNPNPNTGQFGWPRKKVSGVVGVHTAENNTDFSGADSGAEDVARFIGRRTDYGSYHAIADADSRIKLVHPSYAAWADTENNAHGMSVSGAMQAARWRELTPERAAAITRNMAYAAAELVQDAMAAGLLKEATPARRITPAEAIAGSKAGFYGHGETNPGRRYDPGQNFDWNLFLTTYASAIGGITTQGTTITPASEEDDVSAKDVWEYPLTIDGKEYPAHDVLRYSRANAIAAKEKADAAPGLAVQTLLATRIPAPDGSGKSYTIAEYITYGWMYSMKAKDTAAAIEPLDPAVLTAAIAKANATAVASQLEITVKEN